MFRHIGIVVKEIDKMLFFYKEILGLQVISDEIESGFFLETILSIPKIEARIIKLGNENNTILELLDFVQKVDSTQKKINEIGYTHFAITVENIQIVCEKLKKHNFTLLSEPQISVNEKFKVCFCKDSENNFIELVEIL